MKRLFIKIRQKYCKHKFNPYWGNVLFNIPKDELKVFGCNKCGKQILS